MNICVIKVSYAVKLWMACYPYQQKLRLKMLSALVVCYRYLLTFWTDESIMTNIVNLFQTDPLGLHCAEEVSKTFQQTTKTDDYKNEQFYIGFSGIHVEYWLLC